MVISQVSDSVQRLAKSCRLGLPVPLASLERVASNRREGARGSEQKSEGSDELLRRARYSAILIQGQVHRQRQSETKKIIQKSQRKGANIRSGEWTCRACSQKVERPMLQDDRNRTSAVGFFMSLV